MTTSDDDQTMDMMEEDDNFEDAVEQLVSDPAIEREVETVLAGGAVVKTYEGTSQYAQNGISACGLASFNAVRCVLQLEADGVCGASLLREMMSRDLVEESIGICAAWSSSSHLEADDIYKLSLFERSLRIVSLDYKAATYDHFYHLICRLETFTTPTKSAALVITKPPEILALFAIAAHQATPLPQTIFAVFDSHSRPVDHPGGAAISFFGRPEMAAEYLAKLMAVDPSLLNDPKLSWQVDLLSQFSGHMFVAREPTPAGRPIKTELEMELFKANIAGLELKVTTTELKSALTDARARASQFEAENKRLRAEITRIRLEVTRVRSLAEEAERSKLAAWAQLDAATSKKNDKGKSRARSGTPDEELVSWKDTKISIPGALSAVTSLLTGPTPAEANNGASPSMYKARDSIRHVQGSSTSYHSKSPSAGSARVIRLDPSVEEDRMYAAQLHSKAVAEELDSPVEQDRMYAAQLYSKDVAEELDPSVEEDRMYAAQLYSKAAAEELDPPVEEDRMYAAQLHSKAVAGELGPSVEEDRMYAAQLYSKAVAEEAQNGQQESQIFNNQFLKDAHIAAELQRALDQENDILRAEHFALAKSTKQSFECKICFDTYAEDTLAKIDGCDHEFCRECLRGFLESALGDMTTFPIICPVCKVEKKDANEEDQGIVTQHLVEIMGVSEKHFGKWIDLELAKFSILLDCPKCRKSVLVDKEDHATMEILNCPITNCGHRWCKKCHQTVQSGDPRLHSCDGLKEMDALIEAKGWKKCPGCQVPTERTYGCNHMTCRAPGCNTHFCYVDGAFICRTQNSAVAKQAVDAHYNRGCALFDVPEERPGPGPRARARARRF